MILIGIGSNLPADGFSSPQATAAAALQRLTESGVRIAAQSRWYLSEPVPASDQPWFANGVAALETGLPPIALLRHLLALEARFGRERGERNAARTLDLDLLDYHGRQSEDPELILPHPRLHQRRFVLAPLAEIAPDWRHSRLGRTAAELLSRLPPGQPVHPVGDLRAAAR